MTRVIAGAARGRRLQVPGHGTRPTSDRVRESLFSSVDSLLLAQGTRWPDVTVLDLYAGSGAVGLEALSRGARAAVLVERARAALPVLRANVAVVGLPGAHVVAADVDRLAAHAALAGPATLVFVDPPYDVPSGVLRTRLDELLAAGWIAPDAVVIVERGGRDEESPLPPSWIEDRRRTFGDTVLWYGRSVSAEAVEQADSEQGS